MAAIPKFTVVYTTGATSGRAAVASYSPGNSPPDVATAHSILGVTMTASDEDEPIAVLRHGYVRGIVAGDITGGLPSAGTLLWCGSQGKPTTTRPTTGVQVLVGTYMGGGVVDVNVTVLPGVGEMSFVKRETPAEYDVLIWSPTDSAFVPRQLDHGQDFAGLGDDDHPQYAMRRWSWLVGG